MEKAFQVMIGGRVTGVGFRYSALDYAEQFASLKGYVRNAGPGAVEAVVQGDAMEVEQMLQWLRHGPPYAQVEHFHAEAIPLEAGLERFYIK